MSRRADPSKRVPVLPVEIHRVVAAVIVATLSLTWGPGTQVSAGVAVAVATMKLGAASDSLVLRVDSARRRVMVTVGPFTLPADRHAGHATMPGMNMAMHASTPLRRFDWPVSSGLRGFEYEVVDAKGRAVPKSVMHHFVVVNFGRRSLVHPMFERLAGAGRETDPVLLPATLTVPMEKGMPLGIYTMWHNDTGKDLDGVYLKVSFQWTPPNQVPAPINALPLYLDVNEHGEASNDYDLPAGRSQQTFDFTLPVAGRVLALGGHMHNYGQSVRLEEINGPKASVLTELRSKLSPTGTILSMGRKFFGASGDGMPLKTDHNYRVVGTYQNPTGHPLEKAAMASLVGLFVPEALSRWPRIDYNDPMLQKDMAVLGYTKPAGK